MPVVSVKLWDLSRMLGASVDTETLLKVMESLKLEVESLEGDTLTYEAPHDRLDLYSAEGLARAIAYQLGLRKPREYVVGRSRVYVNAESPPDYRPYVMMTIVRDTHLDDEAIAQLFQLQERLHMSHCGDRSLVSIGLYDLDTLEFPVYYREVPAVRFRPLGYGEAMDAEEILERTDKGREYGHLVRSGRYPVLVDSRGTVLSLPPIINSEDTRVTTRTRNVLIDVTGVEPRLMASVLAVMTTAAYERARGSIEVVPVVGGASEELVMRLLTGRHLLVSLERAENLIGVRVSVSNALGYLERHGYVARSVDEGKVLVWVPPYRVDVIDEDDVIEDIAISMDYNKIAGRLEPPTARGRVHPVELLSKHLRDILVGLGFTEVLNFMLTDPDYLDALGYRARISVKNPKMRIYSVLRPSLLPGLLRSLSKNVGRYALVSARLFELGDVVDPSSVATSRRVAGVIYGPGVTLTDALAVAETLLEVLGVEHRFDPAEGVELAIRGRSATVRAGERVLGVALEVHPRYLKYLELSAPVAAFELAVDALAEVLGARG